MDEDFKYKHVGKIPWVAAFLWTVLLAFAFRAYPMESYFYELVRLFLFGTSWWFLFQSIDEWVVKYRRKILFKNPDLKNAYISNKLSEWNNEQE
ncbi:MAG: hypothetical protein AB1560_13565 [Pseudomonadota bacterium]